MNRFNEDYKDLVRRLYDKKAALLHYLTEMVKSADWHAVADAAMDLREIEALLRVLD